MPRNDAAQERCRPGLLDLLKHSADNLAGIYDEQIVHLRHEQSFYFMVFMVLLCLLLFLDDLPKVWLWLKLFQLVVLFTILPVNFLISGHAPKPRGSSQSIDGPDRLVDSRGPSPRSRPRQAVACALRTYPPPLVWFHSFHIPPCHFLPASTNSRFHSDDLWGKCFLCFSLSSHLFNFFLLQFFKRFHFF